MKFLLGFVVLFTVFASTLTLENDSTETLYDLEDAEAYGMRDIWHKVKDAFSKFGKSIQEGWGHAIAKYKPLIIESLKRDGQFMIDEGKKIVIKMLDDVVHVIIDGIDAVSGESSDMTYNAFEETWGKVKVAAKKLGKKIKVDVIKILKEYKEKILDALKDVGRVVIEAGKDWVIEVKDGIVRIIHEEFSETSDGSDPALFVSDSAITYVIDSPISQINWFTNIWHKLCDAVKKLAKHLQPYVQEMIEKYKPRILAALKKVKKIVIREAKEIVIEMAGDVIKVMVRSSMTDEDDDEVSYKMKDHFKDVWGKVKIAGKKLGKKIKVDVVKILKEYKEKIIEALKEVGKVVIHAGKDWIIEVKNGIVKIIHEEFSETSDGSDFESDAAIWYIVDSPVPQINGFTDIWAKVKEACKKFSKEVQAELKVMLEKYKPEIIKALKKMKKVAIKEGKDLIIEMAGDTIKVVIKSGMDDDDDEVSYAFNDVWSKVQSVAGKLKGLLRQSTLDTLEKYKPKIVDAIQNVGNLIISCGHDIIVQVKDDVVKIVSGGEIVTSEEANDFTMDDNYLELDFPPMRPHLRPFEPFYPYSAKDVWGKVKSAFGKFGSKVKAATAAVIARYKDFIIEGLKNDGKVIISEGKKIVIEMLHDICHVIIDGIDAVSGEKVTYNMFNDLWTKIKAAAGNLKGAVRDAALKVIEQFKPQILESLQGLKRIIVKGAKTLVIEVHDAIVKVIMGDDSATSDGSSPASYTNTFGVSVVIDENTVAMVPYGRGRDIWNKVKGTFKELGSKISDSAKAAIIKYKEVIIESLKRDAQVIIGEGKKIVIKMLGDIMHIIIDGIDVVAGEKIPLTFNAFNDVWEKVKEAAGNLKGATREAALKVIEQFKPQIIESLQGMKKIIVKGAKTLVIEVHDAIVKVIAGDDSATSDGSSPALYSNKFDIYGEIDEDTLPMVQYGRGTDIWNKIKHAASKLKPMVREATIKVLKKHKDAFIQSLKNVGKVVIEAGRKIAVTVIDDIVHLRVDDEHVTSEK